MYIYLIIGVVTLLTYNRTNRVIFINKKYKSVCTKFEKAAARGAKTVAKEVEVIVKNAAEVFLAIVKENPFEAVKSEAKHVLEKVKIVELKLHLKKLMLRLKLNLKLQPILLDILSS